jgi:hypothetical protein
MRGRAAGPHADDIADVLVALGFLGFEAGKSSTAQGYGRALAISCLRVARSPAAASSA